MLILKVPYPTSLNKALLHPHTWQSSKENIVDSLFQEQCKRGNNNPFSNMHLNNFLYSVQRTRALVPDHNFFLLNYITS